MCLSLIIFISSTFGLFFLNIVFRNILKSVRKKIIQNYKEHDMQDVEKLLYLSLRLPFASTDCIVVEWLVISLFYGSLDAIIENINFVLYLLFILFIFILNGKHIALVFHICCKLCSCFLYTHYDRIDFNGLDQMK